MAKPFLKWAGGKTQLLNVIEKALPEKITSQNFTYIEPFVGSGAVLFWMLRNFTNLERAVINDINGDLINTYRVIAEKPNELIALLEKFQTDFHKFEDNAERKKAYYYAKRTAFNSRNKNRIEQAALFVFLNRTCFNGLFRVNKSNLFNVPMGSYKKPLICDAENLLAVSDALQRVELLCGDYEETLNYTDNNTIFYFDPPYKPLSNTSSFNSYAKDEFNDVEQIRLRDFCAQLDQLGHHWILSNSDVTGNDPTNTFFDDLYTDFFINRVTTKRTINANPAKRGKLNELLITNYATEQTLQTA